MTLNEIKDLSPTLPNKQRRILCVLLGGGKHSAADLTIRTHFCDPRGFIAELRNKGVPIADEWRRNAENDGNYKVYYLNPKPDTTAATNPTATPDTNNEK